MVKLRLSRGGCKKSPFYRVVITDSRNSRDSCYIEQVGFFDPIIMSNRERFFINLDRVNFWLSKGAQPSKRVCFLINKYRRINVL